MSERADGELEALLRQQESLHAIVESISSELELRPLLTDIVRHACELLDADRGTIGLVDAERNLIRTEAVYEMPPDELGAEMPPGVGLAGRVLETQRPVILERYGDLASLTQPGLVQDAVVGMPIFWQKRMIGFFGVGAKPPRTFDERDVKLLSLLGRHAAVAISNARLFERTQRNLAETQLLYETSRRITAALDVDGVIEAYLQQVAVRGQFVCSVVLYEFDDSGGRTAVVLRGRWSPQEGLQLVRERYPYTRDGLDPPLDAGQTVTMPNVHEDPRASSALRQIQKESGRPALALIPLLTHGERIGLTILSTSTVYQWPEAELWPYQVTAAQLAAAIDTQRQQRLLSESAQEVAVLRERQRLARELHDSVNQLIFSMMLLAQSIAPAWERDPAEGRQRVDRLLQLSQSALAEMRALLFELRTPETKRTPETDPPPEAGHPAGGMAGKLPGISRLQRDGLIAVLDDHIAGLAMDTLSVTLDAEGYEPLLLDQEIALYRITQEALNNVVKHARASRVTVTVGRRGDLTCLAIGDDGVGFSPQRVETVRSPGPDAGGMGLRSMRERAEALGGALQIDSRPGAGTTVRVRLPFRGRRR
ncbi:MAG TPA: GAF domain-containing sensor histidine kinase [Candidatus Sulfomarinibacteraceae bacterium]|nr:GAF domain-containing sensor histidine kinase [Candidatus Sulfomarinibacteraceae bacterium]